jgi:hypothetical protein
MEKKTSGTNAVLKDQSGREKVAIFVDIQKVHEKWSIFCFCGMLCIVVVFENCSCFRCNTQTF